MATFTPPEVEEFDRTFDDPDRPASRLFRYFPGQTTGQTVWKDIADVTLIAIDRSGGIGTASTGPPHGKATGDIVTIVSNNGHPSLNGTFTITVISSDTFTYTDPRADEFGGAGFMAHWRSQLYPYQGGNEYRVFDNGILTSSVADDPLTSLANALERYDGGHAYTVTDSKADELVAAFGANTVDYGHALLVRFGAFGGGASWISTPDHADFAFGQSVIDVRVFGSGARNWAPIFVSTHLIGQNTGGADASWAMTLHATGPRFAIYQPALSGLDELTCELGIPSFTPYGFRTLVRPGSEFTTCDYFISRDGTSWNHRGKTTNTKESLGGWTGFSDIGGVVDMPSTSAGLPWMDRIFWAQIYKDGVLIANPDMRQLPTSTTSFTDSVGKVWTVNGVMPGIG